MIEPLLPLIKEPGRIPKHPFRDIVDAILYLDRSGCSWRQLPVDFPPWQTVYGWFKRWKQRGVTERILDELREQIRLAEGRNAEPSAGVIDSQSVKAADTVSRTLAATTQARKSTGVSDSSSLTPSACWSASPSWPRRGRTATAPRQRC